MNVGRTLFFTGCLAGTALFAFSPVFAQKAEESLTAATAMEQKGAELKAAELKATEMKTMDPKAMMEAYAKAGTPGPEHKEMAKLAGKWKLDVVFWPAPGAPPQKSEASAEFKMILGERYLRQDVVGSMGDQPFEGMGIEGFDNVTKERFGMWIDSSSTGEMTTRGRCAPGEKSCMMKGLVSDPVTGKKVPVREVITMIDDNHFKYESYGPDPGGKEFKMMEIGYARQ